MWKKLCKDLKSREHDNAYKPYLSLGNIDLCSVHKVRYRQSFFTFIVSLSKEFFEQNLYPVEWDWPFLGRIRHISHVDGHVHAVKLVLTRRVKSFTSHTELELTLVAKMLGHIGREDHRDNAFSKVFLVFDREGREDVETFLVEQLEWSGNMVVL